MRNKILALLSSLPVFSLLSCGFGSVNQRYSKYAKYYQEVKLEKKQYKNDSKYKDYLDYFDKKYYQKGLYPAKVDYVNQIVINDLKDSLNQKPNPNLRGFTNKIDETILNYKIKMDKPKITRTNLTASSAVFEIDEKYLENIVKFINNYYKNDFSDVAGYLFFKGIKEHPKAIITAIGGPDNRASDSNGYGIYRKLKSEYDVISLNDSQYSFDPISLYKKISKKTESIGYLAAIKKLFNIETEIANSLMIKLLNYAFSYIDTQRILFLEDYLKNTKQKEPFLYGMSQGYTTLQNAILMDQNILKNAKKIRTENNSLRGWVGLFDNKKQEDYNIRSGGGVLTSSGAQVAIAGSKQFISPLFAFSKRMMTLTKSMMAIYQSIFKDKNQNLKKEYQQKVRIAFSKNDWNIGDITPKEIEFFEQNNINAQVTPEDGHSLNFPISDYIDWIEN